MGSPQSRLRSQAMFALTLITGVSSCLASVHAMGTTPGGPTPTSHPEEYCTDREGDGFYDPRECKFFDVEGAGAAEMVDLADYVVYRRKNITNLRDNCPQDSNPDQLDADGDLIGDLCEYLDLDVGGNHGCAIRADGTVGCWGKNDRGQADAPMWNFTKVTVGRNHSCGLLNSSSEAHKGRAMCWGDNSKNQLATRNGQFVSIRANGDVTCAVDKDGAATCWGECGSDKSCIPQSSAKFIEMTPAFDVSAPDSDTKEYGFCGIDNQLNLTCHGGRPPVTPPAGKFFAFDGGDRYGCALAAGGRISCFARFPAEPGSPPDPMLSPPSGSYSYISVGVDHACAVGFDRYVKCWGSNEFGKATPPPGKFEGIAVGDSHSCARSQANGVVCWGDHGVTSGNLFTHDSQNKLLPRVPQYMEMSANELVTCGVSFDRKVTCSSLAQPSYYAPPGDFEDVTVGEGKSCGRRKDGMTVCWNGTTGETEELPGVGDVAIRRYAEQKQNGAQEHREYLCGIFKNTQKIFCRDQGQPTPAEGNFQFGPKFKEIGVMGKRTVCGITTDERFLCQEYTSGSEFEPKPGPKYKHLSCNSGTCCANGGWTTYCYGADGVLTEHAPPTGIVGIAQGPSHGCELLTTDKTPQCYSAPGELSGVKNAPRVPMFDLSSGTQFACGLNYKDGTPLCWGQVRQGNIERDYKGAPLPLSPLFPHPGTKNVLGDAAMLAP